jgi:uncharacterized protein YecE (DUF72 family)
MKAGGIYIGTSGWSYKSWAENFYPADLPASRHLKFYTTRFPTVEINRTFYRLPTQKAFDDWNRECHLDFCTVSREAERLRILNGFAPEPNHCVSY